VFTKSTIKKLARKFGLYVKKTPNAFARNPAEIIQVDFDFVIRDFLMSQGRESKVCFLQVGASGSGPLRPYIRKYNFSGVFIEPQKYFFRKLKKMYSSEDNIKIHNAAIASEVGQKTLYSIANPDSKDMPEWAREISSLDRNTLLHHADSIPNLKERIEQTQVDALHLMDIVKKEKLDNLDIIQIDVEGLDAEVVRMVNFDVVQPSIIQFEHKHLSSSAHSSVVDYLVSYGFEIGWTGPDTVAYRRP
jgi:FkbM family methyltransferase